MTPEEEIAAFNKSIGVKEAPVTHSGAEPGAGAKPAAAPGPPGGQMLDLSGLPFMERLKALVTGGASLPPDHPARQPIDQGQDLEGPGVMGAKAADAISMGLLPYARDKIA